MEMERTSQKFFTKYPNNRFKVQKLHLTLKIMTIKPLMGHRTKNNQKNLSSGKFKFRLFYQLVMVAFYFPTLLVN